MYSFYVIPVAPEAELGAELKDTLVLMAGSKMKLHATIKGRPTPRVTWAKMNTNIKDRQGIIIKTTDTDTLVCVEKVNRYDAGKYILNLDSVSGMKMYTVVVKVLGEFCDIKSFIFIQIQFFKYFILTKVCITLIKLNRYPWTST